MKVETDKWEFHVATDSHGVFPGDIIMRGMLGDEVVVEDKIDPITWHMLRKMRRENMPAVLEAIAEARKREGRASYLGDWEASEEAEERAELARLKTKYE